jgi:hypothetical protein
MKYPPELRARFNFYSHPYPRTTGTVEMLKHIKLLPEALSSMLEK